MFNKSKNNEGFRSFNKDLETLFEEAFQSAIDSLSEEDKKKLLKLKDDDLVRDLVERFVGTVSDSYVQSIKKDKGWYRMRGRLYGVGFRQRLRKHWAQYYRWSSYAVHTNIKSIFTGGQGEATRDPRILLIGPSDKGFEDALQLSALSLAHATVAVLTAYPNLENLSMAQAIIKYERLTSVTFGEHFKRNDRIRT